MGQFRIISIFFICSLSILITALEMTAADDYTISNISTVHNIISITQTGDGYLWILAGQDVMRFDGLEFEKFPHESGQQDGYELFFHKKRSGEMQKYSTDIGLSSDQIQALIEDRKGFIWVGTKFGLDRLHKASSGQVNTENYLKNVDVLSLFEDKEGNIWVGTRASGLKCLKEKVFTTYSVSNSAASNHFTSLLQDSRGRIWAGTRYGDLYRFEHGHFERIPLEPDIFDNIMFTMEEDNQGRILFGTEYKGVQVYENGKTQPYMAEDGPIAGTVVTLFCDSRSRLWVGRYTKELGFYENGRYSRFLTSQEYPGKMAFSILEDKQQNLWIGGTKGILFLPDGSTDKQNMRWLLNDIPVHSLLEDDSGMIWCGTSENGLVRIHPDTFATIKITEDDGLWSNYVLHILQDNNGYLWLTTYQRIIRVSLAELDALADKKTEKIDCVIFGLSDGLPPPGLNGLVTQGGRLLFATNNGIAEVDPRAALVNRIQPNVLVHKILLNGQTLEMGKGKEDSIKIKSRSHLEIHYRVITFKGQENIQAKYRLNGLENNWTVLPPTQNRVITFNDLTPGQYTFQITACNNHGIWNEKGDYLSFQVILPFFQTIYFKLVLLFVILTATGLLVVQANKRVQKKKGKYRKTRLPEDLAQQYKQKLLYLLEKEKIYRDSSLCIKTLSSKLFLPTHHLSQVINEKFNKNFYELINGYRIEESKAMLIAGDKDQPKILAIAYDVGFNNLSSFNRAFKRHTGKTPTEFKNGRKYRVTD
jgi:ligand-binding sensor domain-containing protein/AraC-like DNA-binding protein